MKNILLIFAFFSIKACAMSDYSDLSKAGEEAIALCLSRYEQIKESDFPNEVDRAYVYAGEHQNKDVFGILFTRGEMGTFGNRDAFYQALVSCDVLLKPEMYVNNLREGYSILKEGEVSVDDTAFLKGHVKELLYLRQGGEFTFDKGQIFSPEKINALQLPSN